MSPTCLAAFAGGVIWRHSCDRALSQLLVDIRDGEPFMMRILAAVAAACLFPTDAFSQLSLESECGVLIHAREGRGFAPIPQGDLFCPLIADPKETRSFIAYQRGKSPDGTGAIPDADPVPLAPFDTDIGAVGVGDAIGLARWSGSSPGDGAQLSVVAGVFAQFDLAASSFDLINADYVIGVPLTFRNRGFSGRLRLYHQSSHLGDEFLLSTAPERVNLSFEAAELILSQAFSALRVYGGGEFFFNRDPSDLDPLLAHGGAEVRVGARGRSSFVAAVDLKSSEQQEWKPSWSARAGFELGWGRDLEHPPRVLRFLAEYYRGPSPYGQFYRENIRYWGAGLHLFP